MFVLMLTKCSTIQQLYMQISNLSSQAKDEYEQVCLSSRLARQDSSSAAATPHSIKQAEKQPSPIKGAEEQLWKDFSASFRRRNNKIG